MQQVEFDRKSLREIAAKNQEQMRLCSERGENVHQLALDQSDQFKASIAHLPEDERQRCCS